MECYVTALFVQTKGVYFIDGVDCWDEKRDARNYNGLLPVVAHPPCQRWGNMAFINYARWGGEHNKPFADNGCFESALQNVNRCSGVLEHPAKTRAFDFYKIQKPNKNGWLNCENYWVCEVWQSAYGHRANKATWVYYVGNKPPFELNWERVKGTHQIILSDNGETFHNLDLVGSSLNRTGERLNIAKSILLNYGIQLKNNELITETSEQDFSQKKHNFISAIIKLNSLYVG